MSEAHVPTIQEELAGLRGAIFRRAAWEGLLAAIATALLVLLAAACILGLRPDWAGVRGTLWGAVAVAASVALGRRLLRARLAYPDVSAAGALVESQLPQFRTDLRTALELAGAGAAPDPVTTALRERLSRRVSSALLAAAPRLSEIVPRASLLPALCLGAASLLALWIGGRAFPDGIGAGIGIMLYGPHISNPTPSPVRPAISALDLLITPPAYTGLAPQRLNGSSGLILALVGSRVDIVAHVLEPLRSVTLVLETDGAESPTATELTPDGELRVSFVVSGSGRYRFDVVPEEGDGFADPVERRVIAQPDRPPRVELIAPPGEMSVVPGQVVDFHFVATDDFGLTEVNLVWRFSGDDESEARRLPLLGSSAGIGVEDTAPFDLAPLMLQPRDQVVVAVEAIDNDAWSEPNTGVSRTVVLTVDAPDELNQEILARKEALFEALLTQLAAMNQRPLNRSYVVDEEDSLTYEPLDGDAATLATWTAATGASHQGWPELLRTMGELTSMMEQDELTPPRDLELLQGARTRLIDLERNEGRLLDRLGPAVGRGAVTTGDFRPLATANAELVSGTERTTLLLDDLIATQKADAAARTLQELDQLRDRLRDLLEQYRATNDPALREQIERELRRLQQRMQELLAQLASQMEQLPYEHLNMEALEESEVAQNVEQMADAFQRIQQMLENGDIEGALAALDSLGQELDELAGEMGASMENGGPEGLSEFDRAMAELMDAATEVEQQQLEIERETNQVNEEMRRERQQQLQQTVDERIARARERIAELRRQMDALETERIPGQIPEQIATLDEQLQRLDEQLSRQDIAGARDQALDSLGGFMDAMQEARRAEALLRGDEERRREAREAGAVSDRGRATMLELVNDMQQLMDMAEPTPSPSQQQRLGELAEQQAQTGEAMQRLRMQAEEMGQRFPSIGEQLGPPMDQAQQGMGSSQGGLRQGRTGPALQGQHQALDGLRSLRDQLRQSMQRQRMRDQAQGSVSREDVEIPEEQERGRQEYRQQVIDAMREGSLEAYEEEIRRYYETLVQ